MRNHLRPAAKLVGIKKPITWHCFRGTFSTLLVANGNDVKTVRHMMRHANSRITLELDTEAVDRNSRKAQREVVQRMLTVRREAVQTTGNA